MKQLKRAPNIFKSKNVLLDTKAMTATSYDWWYFVKKFKNKIVFNNYFYSPSTRKHQHKVLDVLSKLKIKIDLKVEIKESLNSARIENMTLKQLKNESDKQIKERDEARRLYRNAMAKQRREKKKLELVANDLMKNNSGCLIMLEGK